MTILFLSAEVLNITVSLWATRGPAHRFLWPWIPALHLYFALASLAAWKALHEVVARPFYWDKTAHGALSREGDEAPLPASEVPLAAATAEPCRIDPIQWPACHRPAGPPQAILRVVG